MSATTGLSASEPQKWLHIASFAATGPRTTTRVNRPGKPTLYQLSYVRGGREMVVGLTSAFHCGPAPAGASCFAAPIATVRISARVVGSRSAYHLSQVDGRRGLDPG